MIDKTKVAEEEEKARKHQQLHGISILIQEAETRQLVNPESLSR